MAFCPLLTIGEVAAEPGIVEKRIECDKGKCLWWRNDDCVLVAIAQGLANINERLGSIQNGMMSKQAAPRSRKGRSGG